MDKEVKITITYNLDTEEIDINSGFLVGGDRSEYKDPIGYTTVLLHMALKKWIREVVGLICPECGKEMESEWEVCPFCGWRVDE